MKLTPALIRECHEREVNWCAMPRTAAEERQTRAFLQESWDHGRIIVPNHVVPEAVVTLIEQTLGEQNESTAENGSGGTPPTLPKGWRHSHTTGGIHTYKHQSASGSITLGPGELWRRHGADGKVVASGTDLTSLKSHIDSGGSFAGSGSSTAVESEQDIHSRMVAAFRGGVGPAPHVLSEDRGHERDFASLSDDERHRLYWRLTHPDEDSTPLPRFRSVLAEHAADPPIPPTAHKILREALTGESHVNIPEGAHERLARALGR